MRLRTILAAAATPLIAAGIALPTMGAASAAGNPDPGGGGANGTTLYADAEHGGGVTGILTQDQSYAWSITKTVDKDHLGIWEGQTAAAHYTVTATKGQLTKGNATFAGQVGVKNGGAVDTQNLIVKVFLEQKTGTTWSTVFGPQDVPTGGELAAGATGTYPFSFTYTGPTTGTFRVQAPITITNHSGHLNTPFGPTPKADVAYTLNTYNDVVAVQDKMDGQPVLTLGGTSATKTWTYSRDFIAGGDYHNTAQVLGDKGQVLDEKSADVHVDLYTLTVTKTVDKTSLDRTFTWHLGDAQMAQDQTKVHVGDTAYLQVPVTVTAEDSGWKVEGTIKIDNPNDVAAPITSVKDLLPGATISGDPSFSIPAHESVTLSYVLLPGSAADGTNTVEVTVAGTAKFTGTADYSFGPDSTPKVTVIPHGDQADITNHASLSDNNGQSAESGGGAHVTEP